MYADIVVLTYQAPDIESFTYEVPRDLERKIKIGQLVEIPFGKRIPMGIIIALSTQHSAVSKIKPITKIIFPQPILLPYQIELLKWMAAFYLAPMVNCLGAVLPPLNAKRLKTNASGWQDRKGSRQRADFATHTTSPVDKKNRALSGGKILTGPAQTIILAPSINRIPETLAKFPKVENYVVYHNELKPAEKFTAWLKILSGNIDYIFGPRSAIFTPCPNLSEIIIYDEHDGAYKDERSPYFDTLTVAQKIANLTCAELKIVDPAPKISTYFALKNHIKIQNFPQKTAIVNMQNEGQSQRSSPISYNLEDKIKKTLKRNGRVFLFLNKKKESGQMFCKSCKNSEFLQKQPETCPNCGSADIFWNVLNISSLAVEVKKLFPKTKVNIISSTSHSSPDTSQQIDIGTAYSLYAPLAQKYDLITHIQTDSLLNIVDFNSQEKLFAQISSLKKLLSPNGKLLLQTYNPQNPALEKAAGGNYQAFFESEISQRKMLSYPPFGMLFKLTLKGKSTVKVKTEAEKVVCDLKLTINREPSTVNHQLTILGPYEPVFVQKAPGINIICKYPLKNFSLPERERASRYVKSKVHLPKNWQVTVEPDSIN